MTRLSWNAVDKRYFEAGLDRGVLYLEDGSAIPWDGLISVNETGGEATTAYYLDGRPYFYLPKPKEYEATLTAYTYPDAFTSLMGLDESDEVAGFYLDSQGSGKFHLSYRTFIGNATEGVDHGYKIHLVYNASVSSPESSYETLSQEINPSTFSWQINAIPENIEGYRPTAHIVIDTRKMSHAQVVEVENLIYGTNDFPPSLPNPFELLEFLRFGDSIVITDNGDGTWTAEGSIANIYEVDSKIFQIDHVNSVQNGDGTFDISSTNEGGITSVQSILLAEAQRIESESVVTAEVNNGSLLLGTAGGTVFNSGPIAALPDVSDGSGSPVLVSVGSFDTPFMDVIVPDLVVPGVGFKQQNSQVYSTWAGSGISWSPDNKYVAVGGNNGQPFIFFFKRFGDTLIKLPNPTSLPAGQTNDVAWSPNGQYLAIAISSAPFITIYKRSGDVFTKLADPITSPPSSAYGVSWSPDGAFLALAMIGSSQPGFIWYSFSEDTLTKMPDPAVLPNTNCYKVSWASNGTYVAVSADSTPFLFVYKKVGSTLIKLDNPLTLPASQSHSVKWSPDSQYLVVGSSLNIYKRTGDTLTRLSNPSFIPPAILVAAIWSPDNRFLMIHTGATPTLTFYRRVGDTFVKTSNMTPSFGISSNGIALSPDGVSIAVLDNTTLRLFKTAQVTPAGVPSKLKIIP